MSEVLLIRHAETEWSRSGQHTGRTDIPLTERGRELARRLAPVLAGREFALVLSSPLSRARETCELAGLGDRARTRDDLMEWDYGEYEGLTTPQIREQRPDWSLWRDGCPGGETAADVGARVDRVIAEVRAVDGDAALFAHGHVLRVLGARWVEFPPQAGARLALSTGALCTLGYERETAVLWRWNESVVAPGATSGDSRGTGAGMVRS
ncbi:MAG: histidine phosphatase family protein [Solirubrobacterales bacterium]|nr:histidine phosphatase family protein [Solirubrobacterales bacterium]